MSSESLPCVVVDSKEDDATIQTIMDKLGKYGIGVFKESLPTGDFLINDIVIERKTTTDLWSSVLDTRWKNQRRRLKALRSEFRPAILIEGNWNTIVGTRKQAYKKKHQTLSGFNWDRTKQHVLSVYRSICLDPDLIRFETSNLTETCELLRNLALASEKPYDPTKLESLRQSPGKELTLDEWQRYILEGFPGIGAKYARDMLDNYKTLRRIFQILIDDTSIATLKWGYHPVIKPEKKRGKFIQEILWHQYGEERKKSERTTSVSS